MKRRLLAGFLLGFLLVTNAMVNLPPRVFLGLERKENEPEVSSTSLFVRKELSDRIGAAHMGRLGLGESNLMAWKEPRKKNDALKKSTASLLIQTNDQEYIVEPKVSKGINFVIPRRKFCGRSPKCVCLQYYNAKVAADGGRLMKDPSRQAKRQMAEEHAEKKDEAKNLLSQAANEIVNLTHEDYKGMANGKPPINNHEPRN